MQARAAILSHDCVRANTPGLSTGLSIGRAGQVFDAKDVEMVEAIKQIHRNGGRPVAAGDGAAT